MKYNMERPTKDQIRELPLYVGLCLPDIMIIENERDAEQALKALENEVCIGFDTESKPIFIKGDISPGPTLIQLATETAAYLFPTRFPFAVSCAGRILCNPSIKKVGFGLNGDNKELRDKFSIDIVNTEDLSVKLKKLVLKARLGKGAQKSNWGAYPLKDNQIIYAANDAHCAICVELSL
jgi:hypothetical protein